MKTYQIFLLDVVSNKIEKIENYKSDQEELKQRLIQLQEGYCEDESPTYIEKEVTSKGMLLNVAFAESEADFSHGAVIDIIKK